MDVFVRAYMGEAVFSARLGLAPPNAIAHAGAMAGIARNLFTVFAEKNLRREAVRATNHFEIGSSQLVC